MTPTANLELERAASSSTGRGSCPWSHAWDPPLEMHAPRSKDSWSSWTWLRGPCSRSGPSICVDEFSDDSRSRFVERVEVGRRTHDVERSPHFAHATTFDASERSKRVQRVSDRAKKTRDMQRHARIALALALAFGSHRCRAHRAFAGGSSRRAPSHRRGHCHPRRGRAATALPRRGLLLDVRVLHGAARVLGE